MCVRVCVCVGWGLGLDGVVRCGCDGGGGDDGCGDGGGDGSIVVVVESVPTVQHLIVPHHRSSRITVEAEILKFMFLCKSGILYGDVGGSLEDTGGRWYRWPVICIDMLTRGQYVMTVMLDAS